jgi:hypothetical protein
LNNVAVENQISFQLFFAKDSRQQCSCYHLWTVILYLLIMSLRAKAI